MKNKVNVALAGGLGNQMFQYAAGRTLSLRHNVEQVVDSWSGFVRDYQYRRQYELNSFPIRARIAKPFERIPIWIHRYKHRRNRIRANFFESNWYGNFVTDTNSCYLPEFEEIKLIKNTWLVGYWQSPIYFKSVFTTLQSELMPPKPVESKFIALGQLLQHTDSVALGVRLYEESETPSAHSLGSRMKTVAEIRGAIKRLKGQRPKARFYIFCTHRSPLLNQLDLPIDSMFVTHDVGYIGTPERLWLLSRCRHHIITNSSYYWWGAALSGAVRAGEKQYILASDNFVNQDSLLPTWDSF